MATISRFGVTFRSKRELSLCLGLHKSLRDQDLTEEAISRRLGTENRWKLAHFLSERREEFLQSKVIKRAKKINGA